MRLFNWNPVWAPEDEAGDASVLEAIIDRPAPAGGKDEKAAKAQDTEADLEADNAGSADEPAGSESDDWEEPGTDLQDEVEEETEGESDEDQEEVEVEASEDDDDDNYDDYIVEVVVDGEAMEVSLKDLKSNFSANQYIEKNIQQAVERRKQADQLTQQLYETYQQTTERLQRLDQLMQNLATEETENIDWNRLKVEDPALYLVKREEERELRARQQAIQQEAQKTQQQQAQLQAEAYQRLLQSEAQELARKLPEISDPKSGPKLKEKFVSVAAEYGYTPQEVGTVVDHRALLVLRDAIKWREYQASKKEVLSKGKHEAIKEIKTRATSTTSTRQASKKRLADKLRAKARQTGHPDDVAATLLISK